MPANYADLQPQDFEEALARKLPPPGLAWPRAIGSVFGNFWVAIADALAALHARAAVLTEREAFPPTAVELLADWEEVLGLPDPCLPSPASTTARQAAVRARLAATGGQSVPYYQQIAANLGGTIGITEFAPFRWGVNSWGQPLYPSAYAYSWQVTKLGAALFRFDWGVSRWGEPLWQLGNSPIQCEIQRMAPAHTTVTFSSF